MNNAKLTITNGTRVLSGIVPRDSVAEMLDAAWRVIAAETGQPDVALSITLQATNAPLTEITYKRPEAMRQTHN